MSSVLTHVVESAAAALHLSAPNAGKEANTEEHHALHLCHPRTAMTSQ